MSRGYTTRHTEVCGIQLDLWRKMVESFSLTLYQQTDSMLQTDSNEKYGMLQINNTLTTKK